jgi:hypothetical protein
MVDNSSSAFRFELFLSSFLHGLRACKELVAWHDQPPVVPSASRPRSSQPAHELVVNKPGGETGPSLRGGWSHCAHNFPSTNDLGHRLAADLVGHFETHFNFCSHFHQLVSPEKYPGVADVLCSALAPCSFTACAEAYGKLDVKAVGARRVEQRSVPVVHGCAPIGAGGFTSRQPPASFRGDIADLTRLA